MAQSEGVTDHTHRDGILIRPPDSDPRLPFKHPFTFQEAREFGVSAAELATLVRGGVLRRVFTGVYVDSATPDNQITRTRALAKILPPTAVVTDESAGWVHMVDLDPPGAMAVAPPVTVFQRNGATRLRRAGTAGGKRELETRDVEIIHGVQVTTALRTAMDLGRLRPRDTAFAAMNSLLRLGKFDHMELLEQLPRYRRMRGVVQLRELAPMVTALPQSPPESIVLLRCLDHGIPALTPQVLVVRRTGERAYLDLANERLKFAVEFDGREWHEDAQAVTHDGHRRTWLREECGWCIVVLTGRDVYGVPRHHTADVVRRALAQHLRRVA